MAAKKPVQPKKKYFTVDCTNETVKTKLRNYFPINIEAYSREEAIKYAAIMLTDNSSDLAILFALVPKVEEGFIAQLEATDNEEAIKTTIANIQSLKDFTLKTLQKLDFGKIEQLTTDYTNLNNAYEKLCRLAIIGKSAYEENKNALNEIRIIINTLKTLQKE